MARVRSRSEAMSGPYLARQAPSAIRRSAGLPGRRDGEIEGGAAPARALGPPPPAVPVDDPVDGCQPDPGPGEVALAVEALERAEQPLAVGHVEAGPVVPHVVGRAPFARGRADLDLGPL